MPSTSNKQRTTFDLYPTFLYRIFLVFVLFKLCRLFFFTYNISYFSDVTVQRLFILLLGGLRFDLTAILYLNSLYILLQVLPLKIRHHRIYERVSFFSYIIPNSIGIIMNLADTVYYQITLKRTTAAIFQQFANEVNILRLVFRFIVEFWYIDLLAIVLVTLLVIFWGRNRLKKAPKDNIWLYTGGQFILMALTVYLTVVGIRGGFKKSTRPITLSNASAYIDKPNQRAIVLNTPFAIFRTLKKKPLHEKSYFPTQQQQEAVFSAYHQGSTDSVMIKKNVVVLILESFGTEHIGALNNDTPGYKGHTPFLDSLIRQSRSFKYSYANGRKSISGMPSVLASIPSLVAPFILSHYSGNEINSLASTLSSQGYNTAFFHGAANGSMGFDAFANQAGFQQYFGKDEFNNDDHFDGIWGIWDEEFFQFFNTEMGKMSQPFFTTLFSVSSHHPFSIPKKYEDKFPEGSLKIHKAIRYTDYSLGRFFTEAQKSEWFENTIFILTADHASTFSDISKYKTPLGTHAVPIIIYEPGNEHLASMNDSTIVQQTDILPTTLNMLGYPNDYIAFGEDIFDDNAEHFAINHLGDYYQLVMNGYLLQHDGNEALGFYDVRNDVLLKNNALNQYPDDQDKLENKLKAIIQEYNRRLINNDLVVRNRE